MTDIIAIATLMQHDVLAPNAPKSNGADFAAVLEQKHHELLASVANDSHMQRETLQARLEHGANEIHKESTNGIYLNTTKAVVGLVNQDLWRQTFSPAIHMAEIDSVPPTLDSQTDNAPVLAAPLFETDTLI